MGSDKWESFSYWAKIGLNPRKNTKLHNQDYERTSQGSSLRKMAFICCGLESSEDCQSEKRSEKATKDERHCGP